MLTACAPAANNSDAKAQPSASASEAPKGITEFKSEAFDLSKQVSVPVANSDTNILLAGGVVSQAKEEGGKITVIYTPYESKDSAWKYTPEVALNMNPSVQLMRWKDKSYLVLSGWENASEAASGLTAEKKTSEQHVIILDATTGKVVNIFAGEVAVLGSRDPDIFSFDPRSHSGDRQDTAIPFLTGLVYKTPKGQAKLVDPLTGNTVATNFKDYGPTPLNNETGFYTDQMNRTGKSTTKAMFGNFAFVSTENVEGGSSKTGATHQNSTFTLVNTITNEIVSKMNCLGTGDDTKKPTYSADFRYVTFAGQYVFDTKTGKSFCTVPTGQKDIRRFEVKAIDNDGNMYGTADSEYMRINLADITKVETLLADISQATQLPILITDKGSALFYSEQSEDVLVAVPAKTPMKN
jgi:hypothetical protein